MQHLRCLFSSCFHRGSHAAEYTVQHINLIAFSPAECASSYTLVSTLVQLLLPRQHCPFVHLQAAEICLTKSQLIAGP